MWAAYSQKGAQPPDCLQFYRRGRDGPQGLSVVCHCTRTVQPMHVVCSLIGHLAIKKGNILVKS